VHDNLRFKCFDLLFVTGFLLVLALGSPVLGSNCARFKLTGWQLSWLDGSV